LLRYRHDRPRAQRRAAGFAEPKSAASRVIVVERLLVHEALDAVLAVLAAEAALAEAGMEAVRALPRLAVDVDFADAEVAHGLNGHCRSPPCVRLMLI